MMQPLKMLLSRTQHKRRARLATATVSYFLLCSLLLEAASNTTTNWLTLPELLEKWDPVPLAEVQRLAEGGDTTAQHYLGYCNAEGLRVPQNPSEGASWYRRALQGGYIPSANNLGLLYYRGLLGTNDFTKAAEYFRFAAERGLAQSQMNMGVLYRDGAGVAADPKEALRWFRLAANQGHPEAMVEIGRSYRFGWGVEFDFDEAIRWLEKAANEQNSSFARLNLGLLYEDNGNFRKALPFYQQAAEEGETDAMIQLYFCYWNGDGVPADHAKAMEWLKNAADARSPYAECLMGYRCEQVEWVGEDSERHWTRPDLQGALRWYRRSAEQGWAGGQYHLALMYLEGKVVERDEARALELIRAAADQNHEAALIELANLYAQGIGEPRGDSERPVALLECTGAWEDLQLRYENGLGTERDLVMASRCFCERSLNERYYSPYNYDLADLIEFKPGVSRFLITRNISPRDGHVTILGPTHRSDAAASDDLLRVLSLYLKSARGDGSAAFRIGEMYENGSDTPKSASSAWVWFSIAEQNGNAEARDKIRVLEKQMSADEIKSAQNRFSSVSADLKEVAPILR